MKPLRIGCVKYLNARPLIRGWAGDVEFDHPSALCKKLANGDLDVALVSSFEFLRNPIYLIVDGISISSAGPVYSVILAHRGDISEVDAIELDPAAETSRNLLRCLLAELNLAPHLVRTAASVLSQRRGRLLIGDQAIRFRQEHASEFRFWDLGEQWQKLIGLPFVYALWLVRPEVGDPRQIASRLRALRDENLANLDELIAEVVAPHMRGDPSRRKEFSPAFCVRYYREHLRFSFGEKEKEGLRAFTNLCVKHGLLPKHKIEFVVV